MGEAWTRRERVLGEARGVRCPFRPAPMILLFADGRHPDPASALEQRLTGWGNRLCGLRRGSGGCRTWAGIAWIALRVRASGFPQVLLGVSRQVAS